MWRVVKQWDLKQSRYQKILLSEMFTLHAWKAIFVNILVGSVRHGD